MFIWFFGEKNKVILRISKNDIIKNIWNNRKKKELEFLKVFYMYILY